MTTIVIFICMFCLGVYCLYNDHKNEQGNHLKNEKD